VAWVLQDHVLGLLSFLFLFVISDRIGMGMTDGTDIHWVRKQEGIESMAITRYMTNSHWHENTSRTFIGGQAKWNGAERNPSLNILAPGNIFKFENLLLKNTSSFLSTSFSVHLCAVAKFSAINKSL